MTNEEKLLQKIFENQCELIGEEWTKSRKIAYKTILEMHNRQELLTVEQARKEAFEQAEKFRSQRNK